MEIQINNCPVDFILESEKTVTDIINSIADWTQHRNLIFTKAEINNKNYSIDQIPDISLNDIKTINCLIQSKADIVISSLDACIDYCIRVQDFLKASVIEERIDIDEIKNIVAGIGWIVEVLGKISELLGLNINEITYKDNFVTFYIEKLINLKNALKNNTDQLIDIIDSEKEIFPIIIGILKIFLMSENMKSLVIQSIDSPDVLLKSLLNIKEEILIQLTNLDEIVISYQTGKDDIAIKKFDLFIDFIFNCSRTCYQIAPVFGIDLENIIVDDLSLNGKNIQFQNLLNNIKDAMENNDIISLCDILEFEMKPSLENFEVYIDSLIVTTQASSARA